MRFKSQLSRMTRAQMDIFFQSGPLRLAGFPRLLRLSIKFQDIAVVLQNSKSDYCTSLILTRIHAQPSAFTCSHLQLDHSSGSLVPSKLQKRTIHPNVLKFSQNIQRNIQDLWDFFSFLPNSFIFKFRISVHLLIRMLIQRWI